VADQAGPVTDSVPAPGGTFLPPLEIPGSLAATIVLVRHGESTFVAEGRFQGRLDPPLSDLGRRQAELVGLRLADRDSQTPLPIPVGSPVAIWHSPLSRAAGTASIIASHQPDEIQLHPIDGLTEIAQGDWEGQPLAEVKARWSTELAAWRSTPVLAHAPGGEALRAAAMRVRSALGEVIGELAAASEIVADSAGSVLAYDPVPGYASYASSGPREPWALVVAHDGIFRLALINLLAVPLERFWHFPFNLAAITVVQLHGSVAALRAHNLSEHLAPLAEHERAAQESRGDRRGAL
jgi:probable phosphoglycerate mutase